MFLTWLCYIIFWSDLHGIYFGGAFSFGFSGFNQVSIPWTLDEISIVLNWLFFLVIAFSGSPIGERFAGSLPSRSAPPAPMNCRRSRVHVAPPHPTQSLRLDRCRPRRPGPVNLFGQCRPRRPDPGAEARPFREPPRRSVRAPSSVRGAVSHCQEIVPSSTTADRKIDRRRTARTAARRTRSGRRPARRVQERGRRTQLLSVCCGTPSSVPDSSDVCTSESAKLGAGQPEVEQVRVTHNFHVAEVRPTASQDHEQEVDRHTDEFGSQRRFIK